MASTNTIPIGDLEFSSSTSSPLVSLIVPVYNQHETTLRCLSSVLQHSKNIDYEAIVADDASSDETQQMLNRIRGIRISRMPNNRGFLDNCNAAARIAMGEYLVFLSNDTQVKSGWLQALVDLQDQDPKISLVGGKLLYPDGRLKEAGGIVWNNGGA